LLHVKAYDDIKEAEIFFVSFFFENKFFILHAFAVLLSFLAFLTAVFSFFKEKKRLILAFFAAFISLVVILLYVLGYDVLFQISLIL
jgi:heme/copper-type cytochrome/quinol oxidase subunit 4